MIAFINACDRFRKTKQGEELWQEMMRTREEIKESDFLYVCDVSPILDKDESWEEYKENKELQGDPIRYYSSAVGLLFFQTAGFEFIWGDYANSAVSEVIKGGTFR